jgi:hypothetical protein
MKTVFGTFNDAAGNPVANGRVFFALSQDAVASNNTQVSHSLISFNLNGSGAFSGSIFFNDELFPSGVTSYTVTVLTAGNGLVYGPETFQLTGPSFNLNTAVPNSQGILVQALAFQKQIFTSSGTFTIPANITQVKATVTGGGGGGGGSSTTVGGDGGGAGGTAIKWLVNLTPANTIIVTVGTGGAAGLANASGGNGVASTIASGTQSITTVTGSAGLGGQGFGFGAGLGGGATNGDINITGSPGEQTIFISGSSQTIGTNGGSSALWGAGGGLGGNNTTGGAGTSPGGGGGGAGANGALAGGAGAAGIVLFEWIG